MFIAHQFISKSPDTKFFSEVNMAVSSVAYHALVCHPLVLSVAQNNNFTNAYERVVCTASYDDYLKIMTTLSTNTHWVAKETYENAHGITKVLTTATIV